MRRPRARLEIASLDAEVRKLKFESTPEPGLTPEFSPLLCPTRQSAYGFGAAGWPLSGVGGWVYAQMPILHEFSVFKE